jgi:hypothetical protein
MGVWKEDFWEHSAAIHELARAAGCDMGKSIWSV